MNNLLRKIHKPNKKNRKTVISSYVKTETMKISFTKILVYQNAIDLPSLKTHTEVFLNKVGSSSNKTIYKI